MAHARRGRNKARKPARPAAAPVPLKASPDRRSARGMRLDLALSLIAAGVALWIVATTLVVIRAGYVPLPAWDEWDLWSRYLVEHYSLRWFFEQHNEHRLVVPSLLFAIDRQLFHAREWFLLVCSFALQAVSAVMLWRLFARTAPSERSEDVMAGAVIVSCLFSGQQYVNFIWGFQVQFLLVYCCAIGSLLALLKGAEHRQDGRDGRWLVVSTVLAAAATYSMANGILVWPLLILLAWRLGTPRLQIAAVAAAAALVGVPYFWGWHRNAAVPSPFASPAHAATVALFWLGHLGSPLSALSGPGYESAVILAARIAGGVVLFTVLAGYVALWRSERSNGARAVLLHFCGLVIGSSALMAAGRSQIESEMFTPRYLTPAYLLWVCLLIWAWPLLRRIPRPALYTALTGALLAGIGIHQGTVLQRVRDWAASFRVGETAAVAGVLDADAWKYVYHTPLRAFDSVDYLRNHRLSLFTEEWTHWPGMRLAARFSIDRKPEASCQGAIEAAGGVPSPPRPGWHFSGWAWDVKARRTARYVILGDEGGDVAGVALGGFSDPRERSGVSVAHPDSTWHGFISGPPRMITAYVLEADNRSLCAIGSRAVRRFGSSVPFADLAAPLSGGDVHIEGRWVKDGYYKPIGPPPTGGLVFGSYAGADSNTGTLRLGPFHLDEATAIAIPLVTGPSNAGLSLTIRDAATQKILAEANPPPLITAWWAWRPDMPASGAADIEIIAEDNGTGYGQWLAIGWPRQMRRR